MSMHPAVRQVLADRLARLQREVEHARRDAALAADEARAAHERWVKLGEEKRAIQGELAQAPADRAEVYPEGVTPPPAERAPQEFAVDETTVPGGAAAQVQA